MRWTLRLFGLTVATLEHDEQWDWYLDHDGLPDLLLTELWANCEH